MVDLDLLIKSLNESSKSNWKEALMDALIEQNIQYNSETYELVQDTRHYKIGDLVIYYLLFFFEC